MARRTALLAVAVAMAVWVGGCASKSDFAKLAKRVDTIQAEQGTQNSEMTKFGNSLRAVESNTQERVAGVDERIAAVDASLKKLEADLAEVSKEIARLAEAHKKLDARFGGVTKSVAEAQKMLLSTLKNARDIYGAQFRALNEVLETLDDGEAGVPPGD